MSEYMEKHTVSRLLGAPPGYVGYEEGGALTEAVRRRPYSVVLFDEIEKAHPDVFNVLLQLLEDGRITDGQGHTVDFKNTIVILTSNVGSQFLAEDDYEKAAGLAEEELRRTFRPEFLNRIDAIIVFHRLRPEDLQEIVGIQLARLTRKLADKNIAITFRSEANKLLAGQGYDPVYGARPLKRLIQQKIVDELALELLEGKFKAGDAVNVGVNSKTETFTFEKK
jgi:ATP-dependent Clp protease ATP-binding subunit ClpB